MDKPFSSYVTRRSKLGHSTNVDSSNVWKYEASDKHVQLMLFCQTTNGGQSKGKAIVYTAKKWIG